MKATRYRLESPGIEFQEGRNFPCCPERPQGPASFLYNAYWILPGGKAAAAWCLPSTSLYCWARIGKSYTPASPLYLHRRAMG
jgi:hypothetical protein